MSVFFCYTCVPVRTVGVLLNDRRSSVLASQRVGMRYDHQGPSRRGQQPPFITHDRVQVGPGICQDDMDWRGPAKWREVPTNGRQPSCRKQRLQLLRTPAVRGRGSDASVSAARHRRDRWRPAGTTMRLVLVDAEVRAANAPTAQPSTKAGFAIVSRFLIQTGPRR